jgi:hypothetical protein
MAEQIKPSEKEAESKATGNPEDIKDREEKIDYKKLSEQQKAEYDVLLSKFNKLEEFKRETEKAERKQLEDKVKYYFPDLNITAKTSDSYLNGLLTAAEKLKVSGNIDEENHIPDKTEPTGKLMSLSEEEKLIKKLLDG